MLITCIGILCIVVFSQRNCRGSDNPCDSVKFEVEERIECTRSKKVKYTHRADYLLALPIPMDAVTNDCEYILSTES